METQLQRYNQLLVNEKAARSGRIALAAQNDRLCYHGPADLKELTCLLLQQLDCCAVIVGEPTLPFGDLLIQRAVPPSTVLTPRDSESRSSLHAIPCIPFTRVTTTLVRQICEALQTRKGCIVERLGLVSMGSLTVEQAYIVWSSLVHATTIKYFEDLLTSGPQLKQEAALLQRCRSEYLQPLQPADYYHGQLRLSAQGDEIAQAMCAVGRATVMMGLVDSFFGNISCTTETGLYISQTSARLDELQQQVDFVPIDGSSTSGITASSELPAHRAIAAATGCRAILHGHPRFSVIMSFFADIKGTEGWEQLDGIPIVRGEGGVGGLAESLSAAFSRSGGNAVIVEGHGVFAISPHNFSETLETLSKVEQQCRSLYFRRIAERYGI